MHPFQTPRIGKIRQIPANGLKRHVKMPGKPLDRNLAFAARDLKNFGMAE